MPLHRILPVHAAILLISIFSGSARLLSSICGRNTYSQHLFQMYCNYIDETITNEEYQLLLSHQEELFSMAQSHSLEYSIYTVLVEVAPSNLDNELLMRKLLLLDNPIVKVYDGTWHLYENSITYENVQAYRINCIDITGKISFHDVSVKNYTALKNKTETLKGLYKLCKNVNESNTDTETTTIMFSSEPSKNPNRYVFCQEVSRSKDSLTWQLVRVTMAGTLTECINYRNYTFEPIVLKSSFIRSFIQKDNIIEQSLLSKMITYDKEFLIIRNHTVVYHSLVKVPLTKDICKSLLALVEYFQSNTDKTIQLNDTIMIKKVKSQQALAYQYLGCNNFKKVTI